MTANDATLKILAELPLSEVDALSALARELLVARTRIAELEDTIRYQRASGDLDRINRAEDAARILHNIAMRRGGDWTGVDVLMEPKP